MVRIQRSDKWDEIAHRDNDGVYVLPDVNRMFAVALLIAIGIFTWLYLHPRRIDENKGRHSVPIEKVLTGVDFETLHDHFAPTNVDARHYAAKNSHLKIAASSLLQVQSDSGYRSPGFQPREYINNMFSEEDSKTQNDTGNFVDASIGEEETTTPTRPSVNFNDLERSSSTKSTPRRSQGFTPREQIDEPIFDIPKTPIDSKPVNFNDIELKDSPKSEDKLSPLPKTVPNRNYAGHNRDKSVEHGWENFQPHPSFDRTPSGLMRMRSDESTRTVKDSDSDSDSCENEKGSRESLKIQTRPTRVSTQEIFDYTDKGKVEKILKNVDFLSLHAHFAPTNAEAKTPRVRKPMRRQRSNSETGTSSSRWGNWASSRILKPGRADIWDDDSDDSDSDDEDSGFGMFDMTRTATGSRTHTNAELLELANMASQSGGEWVKPRSRTVSGDENDFLARPRQVSTAAGETIVDSANALADGVLAVGGAVGDGVLAVGEGVVGVGGAVVGGVVAGGAMVGDGLMYTGEQVVGGAGVVLDLMVPRQIKCRPAIFGSGLMFKRFRPQMSGMQFQNVKNIENKVTDWWDYSTDREEKNQRGFEMNDFRQPIFQTRLQRPKMVYPKKFAEKLHAYDDGGIQGKLPTKINHALEPNDMVHMLIQKAIYRILFDVQKISYPEKYYGDHQPKEKYMQAYAEILDKKLSQNERDAAATVMGMGREHGFTMDFVNSVLPDVQKKATIEATGGAIDILESDIKNTKFPTMGINVTNMDKAEGQGIIDSVTRLGRSLSSAEVATKSTYEKDAIFNPMRDPNILTVHVKNSSSTDFFVQSLSNIWMGEFAIMQPQCAMRSDPIRKAVSKRPFSTGNTYTEEYCVNKHCGMCGRPICDKCIELIEKQARVKPIEANDNFDITKREMLTYELLDDPNQHVRMDPKGKNKIVDFDFQNGTYMVKCKVPSLIPGTNVAVPGADYYVVVKGVKPKDIQRTDPDSGRIHKEKIFKKASHIFTESIHFQGGIYIVQRQKHDGGDLWFEEDECPGSIRTNGSSSLRSSIGSPADRRSSNPFSTRSSASTPSSTRSYYEDHPLPANLGICWDCINKEFDERSYHRKVPVVKQLVKGTETVGLGTVDVVVGTGKAIVNAPDMLMESMNLKPKRYSEGDIHSPRR